MTNIELEIEWTEPALKKIQRLTGTKNGPNADAPLLALPPIESLPMEGDVLFLGPKGKQEPFIVVERQYHHEDGDGGDWRIVLILDLPE